MSQKGNDKKIRGFGFDEFIELESSSMEAQTAKEFKETFTKKIDEIDKVKEVSKRTVTDSRGNVRDVPDARSVTVSTPVHGIITLMCTAYGIPKGKLIEALAISHYAKHGEKEVAKLTASMGTYKSKFFKK